MTGTLVAIYTAAGEAAPMQTHREIAAIAGAGLAGDRYAASAGAFSDKPGGGREVTLIAREGITAANHDVPIAEDETRRNLVTEGVDLDAYVGRTFSIGEVVLRGVRDCPPCQYLEGLTRPGVLAALKGRGGLRAEIVRSGTLRVGDEITETEAV